MNEDLKRKFLDFEVSPPPSVWNGIAMQLNEQGEDLLLREKVLEFEIEPPAKSWSAIFEAISTKTSAVRPVRFFQRKQFSQAAAVLAGVILVGSFFMLNNKVRKNQFAITETSPFSMPKEIIPSEPASGPARKPLMAQISAGMPKASALYAALRIKKKNPPSSKRELDQTIVRSFDDPATPEPNIAARPIRNENGDIIQDLKLMNRPNNKYVSVTGPNGAQTKISAKFAHFLLYLNGDNDTDSKEGVFHKSFLESLTWKARFQNWRTALSQNAFVPTSTNFMDILELKDIILQQKDID